MKKRSVLSVILLTLVTCGIYGIYWFIVVTNEIEEDLADRSNGCCSNGVSAFLLNLVTCGIYGVYWWYTEAKRLALLGELRGVNVSDNSMAYLVLSLFGLGIVSTVLMQNDMNAIADEEERAKADAEDIPTIEE